MNELEQDGEEESGYASGYKPDLTRVFQANVDINQKNKIWIRESDPVFRDYRFWHLVDISGSMMGNKIEEVYRGFTTVCESVDRLEDYNSEKVKIQQGVTGFNNSIFPYKDFSERLTMPIEKKLSNMIENCGGSTETAEATQFAIDRMLENVGKTGNFLLTFTDGSPDDVEKLGKILKKSQEIRIKNNLKVGVIWLSRLNNKDAIKELNDLMKSCNYDFGLVMTLGDSAKGNFSEKLADLIEDIISNPSQY